MSKQAHTFLFWFVVMAIALALSAGVQKAIAVQTEAQMIRPQQSLTIRLAPLLTLTE